MPIDLSGDHHVHSTYSDDGHSTVAQNLAVAGERGVTRICLADHVRADTTWVPEFAATVAGSGPSDVVVLCGVEAKILDAAGHMDVPTRLPTVDRVLIADHQFPGSDGPVPPQDVRAALETGRLCVAAVIETLVRATCAAMLRVPGPQLAHLFSIVPKVGLSEDAIGADEIDAIIEAAAATGAVIEVNEKWQCPAPSTVQRFQAAGLPVVASTDSHRADDIAVYRWLATASPS